MASQFGTATSLMKASSLVFGAESVIRDCALKEPRGLMRHGHIVWTMATEHGKA